MQYPQDWSARVLTLRNKITFGTCLVLMALLLAAGALAHGIRGLLAEVQWQAKAYEAGERIYALDKRLLTLTSAEPLAPSRLRALLAETAKEVDRLNELGGDEPAQAGGLLELRRKVNVLRGGELGTAGRGGAAADQLTGVLEELRSLVEQTSAEQSRQVARHAARAERVSQQVALKAGACGLFIILLLFFAGQRLTAHLTTPIQQMILAIERLMRRDIAPRVDEQMRDELGQLARAFNRMAIQISEREAAALARNRQLDELHVFNAILQTSGSEGEIHRALLQKVRAFDLSQALILDHRAEEGSLTVAASLHPLEAPLLTVSRAEDVLGNWLQPPPACRVIRAGREVVIPEIADDLICADCHFGQARGSAFCVPITAGGQTIGALHLASPKAGYWTDERQRLVKAYADQAAPAIRNLRLMRQLRNSALMDEQTQVYNRRFLDGYLRKQFAQSRRAGQPLSVLMLDIDHFKRFNDLYGHEAGDTVLRQFAATLSGALREGELVARYGGEEFTIVMNGSAREALTLAERLRRAVAELSFRQFTKDGEEVGITMSIGIADYPANGQSPEEVLKAADLALYRAKDSGRDCVRQATRALLAVRNAKS